ncbi:potassium/sodium hyperpolarization-activated cyclic nucleotide-gated channel 1 [Histomonas meleagridis]|uniref:potassium/sodium hyperpolarization-activated cyclic nucleotide-gated channel 1 n=1 Tax=Histomonas meleagridis TaxID=135588 RepID=UPI003559ABA5|nr:potassium/sodium hyperpolarization-activated cyclic nucleotide-gated channel 1 [Histomonas meleagridis]KAH0804984.1 potassium/sodium hyperpolarization-activated cyclic nucleotide-gated channel 1 [Histomonas meleagridis]
MEGNNISEVMPKYFETLSPEDQEEYKKLRAILSSKDCRNNRGQRLTKFSEMLSAIQKFCIRNDQNDSNRCLVCGICWLPNGIAINTRQLRLLIDKCKSSINGSLQRIGFSAVSMKDDSYNKLYAVIPQLKNNYKETREWSIRQTTFSTPQAEIPVFTPDQKYMFPTPAPTFPQVQTPQPNMAQLGMSNNSFDPDYQNETIPPEVDDWNDPFCLTPSFVFDDSQGYNDDDQFM